MVSQKSFWYTSHPDSEIILKIVSQKSFWYTSHPDSEIILTIVSQKSFWYTSHPDSEIILKIVSQKSFWYTSHPDSEIILKIVSQKSFWYTSHPDNSEIILKIVSQKSFWYTSHPDGEFFRIILHKYMVGIRNDHFVFILWVFFTGKMDDVLDHICSLHNCWNLCWYISLLVSYRRNCVDKIYLIIVWLLARCFSVELWPGG